MGECLPKIWDFFQKFGFGDCHGSHFLYAPAVLLQYYYCSLSFKSSGICYKTAHGTRQRHHSSGGTVLKDIHFSLSVNAVKSLPWVRTLPEKLKTWLKPLHLMVFAWVWFGLVLSLSVFLSVCLSSALTCFWRDLEPQSALDTVGFQLFSYMCGVEDGTRGLTHAKLGTTELYPQPADAMLFFFKTDFRSVICTSLRVDM